MKIPIISIIFLTVLILFLLSVFNVLYFWTIILAVLGGIFLIAFYVDFYNKKHNIKPNYEGGSKNESEPDRAYTQNGLHQVNDFNDPGDFF